MRPVSRALSLAAAVTAVACFELSGPNDGVVSITGIRAASPAVAVNDVMRDSNGNPAPLTIIALDENGDTVRDVQATFVVIDDGASVDAAALVRGEEVRAAPIRIAGSVGRTDFPGAFCVTGRAVCSASSLPLNVGAGRWPRRAAG